MYATQQPAQPVQPNPFQFAPVQPQPLSMKRGGKGALITIIVVSIILYVILLGLSAATLDGLNKMKEG